MGIIPGAPVPSAPRGALNNQLFDNLARLHAGESLIESLVFERELLVIETQQMQHGSVEIVDVAGVFDDVIGEVVGFSVDSAGPGAAAGHPHGEAARVVVAAVIGFRNSALAVNGAAEFAAPDDEGVSNMPRCLRSWISPQQGWSVSAHWSGMRLAILPWWSQLL